MNNHPAIHVIPYHLHSFQRSVAVCESISSNFLTRIPGMYDKTI